MDFLRDFSTLFILLFVIGGVWCLVRRKDGRKYSEKVFLSTAAALMVVLGLFNADCDYQYRETWEHMRAALIRCGEMLKNGEQDLLAQRLTAFVESPEAENRMYPFSVAFLRAVAPEMRLSSAPTIRIVLLSFGGYFAVCLGLLGIWRVMLRRGVKPEKRYIYLEVLIGLALILLFLTTGADMTKQGYCSNGFRWDIRELAEEVARPEEPWSGLLPLLENPDLPAIYPLHPLSAHIHECHPRRPQP